MKHTVDFFKDTGKWYESERVEFDKESVSATEFADALHVKLWMPVEKRHVFSGMTAVCVGLSPPMMMKVDDIDRHRTAAKTKANTVKVGDTVTGRHTDRKGKVIDIAPAGFIVEFGEASGQMFHPHLHLRDADGRDFEGPWWPR